MPDGLTLTFRVQSVTPQGVSLIPVAPFTHPLAAHEDGEIAARGQRLSRAASPDNVAFWSAQEPSGTLILSNLAPDQARRFFEGQEVSVRLTLADRTKVEVEETVPEPKPRKEGFS